MNKKIIALALATLMLLLSFSACGKEKTIVKGQKGQEYEAISEKNGEYVTNEHGDIAVYVTDEKGKRMKNDKGEYVKNYVKFPSTIIKKQTIETQTYKITYPKDWKIDSNGVAHINENATLQIVYFENFENNEKALNEFFESQMEQAKEIKNTFKEQGIELSETLNQGKILQQEVPYRSMAHSFSKDKNSKQFYSQSIYFIYKGKMYTAMYTCNEGGYDSELDIVRFITDNMMMK